jgi:hypothetical protein
MKILYVTDQFYLHGGIEKMLSQKINHWIKDYGYEVILCTSEQREKEFVYAVDLKLNHIDLEINYFRKISYFHPKNILKSIDYGATLLQYITRNTKKVCQDGNIDAIYYYLSTA